MSKHAIVTEQERARLLARIMASSAADGDCLIWHGAVTRSGQPVINFRCACRYVRGLLHEIHNDAAPRPGLVLVPYCRNKRCISQHCMRAMTIKAMRQLDARRGVYTRADVNAKRLNAARKRVSIPDEVVQRVRDFEGTPAEAAQATGVSLSYAKAIRSGRARAPLGNPWKGLL